MKKWTGPGSGADGTLAVAGTPADHTNDKRADDSACPVERGERRWTEERGLIQDGRERVRRGGGLALVPDAKLQGPDAKVSVLAAQFQTVAHFDIPFRLSGGEVVEVFAALGDHFQQSAT